MLRADHKGGGWCKYLTTLPSSGQNTSNATLNVKSRALCGPLSAEHSARLENPHVCLGPSLSGPSTWPPPPPPACCRPTPSPRTGCQELHTHARKQTHSHTHIEIHTHGNTHTYMYTYTHTDIHMSIRQTHKHTDTHTYRDTHTSMSVLMTKLTKSSNNENKYQ